MSYIRDIVAAELASSNPSLKPESTFCDRRLAELVSSLKTPTHPAYGLMIRRAIEELNERGGSSEKAISEFIVGKYEDLPLAHEVILKHHLRKLCEKQEVLCTDNERYILLTDGAAGNAVVGMQQKKRKNRRGKGRLVRGKHKDSKVTKGGDIGEGHQSKECEIEGICDHKNREEEQEEVAGKLGTGKGENFEVAEERPEAEREEMEVTKVQVQRKNMKLNNEASNEAIMEQFNNATCKASQKNREFNEGNEAKLGVILEQNKPQPQQTEAIEKQLQLEDVQKQWQQDTSELYGKRTSAFLPTATTPPADLSSDSQRFKSAKAKRLSLSRQQQHNQGEVQRRKLRSHTSHNVESATAVTICELPLLSQQAEHQDEEKQSRQRRSKRKIDMGKSSEVELPSVIHHHQNEPSLKRLQAQGRLAKLRSEVDALTAPSDVQFWDQNEQQNLEGERELSLPQQQLQNQNFHQLPRRILHSHRTQSSVSDSPTPTPTLTLSCMPSRPQNKQQQQGQHQVLGKRRGRPPKLKTDMDLDAGAALSLVLQHNEDKNQPPKRLGRGRPPNPKPNSDVTMVVCTPSDVLPRKGRGRPPKLKTDTALNSEAALSLALQHHEEDKEAPPPKRWGRGRPPKTKPNADATMVVFEPSTGPQKKGEEKESRQRHSKRKIDMGKSSEVELPSVIYHHQNEPSLKRPQAQGRLAKLRSEVDALTDFVPPSDVQLWDQNEQQKLEGEKELSVPRQQLQNQSSHQLPRRILRSHHTQSSVSDSPTTTPTPTPTLSRMPSRPQNKQHQGHHQVLGKRRGRPPKLKTDMDLDARVVLQHNEDENQAPKRLGRRGRPPKPKPNADTTMVVCTPTDVLPRKGRGRPPKLKTDAALSSKAALSLVSQHHEEDKEAPPPKRRGRGRPPKTKRHADTARVGFKPSNGPQKKWQGQLPYKGRGRPPKANKAGVVTMASFSNHRLRKKQKTEQPEGSG